LGVTFEVGSQGELLTTGDTTLITPFLETTPVSGFPVSWARTEYVLRFVMCLDASAAFGHLLIGIEHINHRAEVSVGQRQGLRYLPVDER
jgi:hypothetical protein